MRVVLAEPHAQSRSTSTSVSRAYRPGSARLMPEAVVDRPVPSVVVREGRIIAREGRLVR